MTARTRREVAEAERPGDGKPHVGTEAPQPASDPIDPVQPQPEPSGPDPQPVQPQPQPGDPLDDVDDYPLSASEALVAVMRAVRPITKSRQADQRAGGYSFRGIDEVYDGLHDLFAEHGLVVLPQPLDVHREQRQTSGSPLNVTQMLVQFTFLAADGSREVCSAWGEGGDTGDKSTQKAHSQAIKSALLEVFLIPTRESQQDEPDATNSPPARTFTAEEIERAGNAYGAALDANTVEALAGVRQRALALLDVPVRMVDETLVPLALLFEQRRNIIERNTEKGSTQQ